MLKSSGLPKKFVPRIRLAVKEDKCLIVVYIDVDDFERFEIIQTSSGTANIYQMRNTYDRRNVKPQHFSIPSDEDSFSSILFGTSAILKHYINDPTIIGTFELEFSERDEMKQEKIVEDIERHLKLIDGPDSKLLIKKLVTNSVVHENVAAYALALLFQFDGGIGDTNAEKLVIHSKAAFPIQAFDSVFELTNNGDMYRNSMITCYGSEGVSLLYKLAEETECFATLRFSQKYGSCVFDDQKFPIRRLNEKVELKRFVNKERNQVTRMNKSACGVWFHCLSLENEKKYEEYFKKETCGLRWFCKECSDPFEYWFYHNLPRRVYHETEWCDVVDRPESKEKLLKYEKELEVVKAKVEKEEKEKQKELEEEKQRIWEEQNLPRNCWTRLPLELKHEVIKKLDLMSRHAMRTVSRRDRVAVDSSHFHVPRVRLSIKEDKCMLMVYIGIETFLRLELRRGKGGVAIYKLENSYNLKEADIKQIPKTALLPLSISILKSLFLHKSVLLGTMEIEFFGKDELIHIELTSQILKRLWKEIGEKRSFRVKRLVFSPNMSREIQGFFVGLFGDNTVRKEARVDEILIGADHLVPEVLVTKVCIQDEMNLRNTRTAHNMLKWVGDDVLGRMKWFENAYDVGFTSMRFSKPYKFPAGGFEVVSNEMLNEHVKMSRCVNKEENLVLRMNQSSCGFWMNMVKAENEAEYLEYFKTETCGLETLCKKCCDPFDYWFYRTLPRRLYYEPEWCDVVLCQTEEVRPSVEYLAGCAGKLIKDIVAEEKLSIPDEKNQVKSWGFRKMVENVERSSESEESGEPSEVEEVEQEVEVEEKSSETICELRVEASSEFSKNVYHFIDVILFSIMFFYMFYSFVY
ncbi:hypothetical protein GCK72_019801 [Caenorhabditis remanei]|uniref:F-box domain-containing protein n=1 Tax=Caenorhabditis remanei TaxID=31234 RepID=A0A6A5GEY2_CAERE|nr:hypothetical protein GCK72_019801 [Caenorhabditis remanei]KAF1753245.1 hypothetical protein GCK72_019801 [Caenorhabditis remanei]